MNGVHDPVAIPAAGSAAWHTFRQTGIGASEIAQLLGVSPHGGPMAVYLRKVTPYDELAAAEPTTEQARGLKMEPYLADAAAEAKGWTLLEVPTQRHPKLTWLLSSPDRVIMVDGKPAALLEIKTAKRLKGEQWLDPAEDPTGVPMHYLLQVQQQLLVGVEIDGVHYYPERAYLVACIAHLDDIRVYEFERHPGLWARIGEESERFWREHVLKRVPPPMDGTPAGDALLRALFPKDVRPELARIEAGDIAHQDMMQLRALREQREAAEQAEETVAQRLKLRIGDGAGLYSDAWRCTWKATKATEKTDWQAVAADLQRKLAHEVGETEAAAEVRLFTAAHTTTKPGARRFLPTWTD